MASSLSDDYQALDSIFRKLGRSEQVSALWEHLTLLPAVEDYVPQSDSSLAGQASKILNSLTRRERGLFVSKYEGWLESEIMPLIEGYVAAEKKTAAKEGPSLSDRAWIATILARTETLTSKQIAGILGSLGASHSNLGASIETWLKNRLIAFPPGNDEEFTLTPFGEANRKQAMKNLLKNKSP